MTDFTKYEHILSAIAKGQIIEKTTANGEWFFYESGDVLIDIVNGVLADRFRIKPRIFKIGKVEVPAPRTDEPEKGDECFALSFGKNDHRWCNDDHDRISLENGLIFNTESDRDEVLHAISKMLSDATIKFKVNYKNLIPHHVNYDA